jgi:hypothetical protein
VNAKGSSTIEDHDVGQFDHPGLFAKVRKYQVGILVTGFRDLRDTGCAMMCDKWI